MARLVVFRVQSSRWRHILIHSVILVNLLIDSVLNLGQIRLLSELIAHLRRQAVQMRVHLFIGPLRGSQTFTFALNLIRGRHQDGSITHGIILINCLSTLPFL